jgi:hypothetical protein
MLVSSLATRFHVKCVSLTPGLVEFRYCGIVVLLNAVTLRWVQFWTLWLVYIHIYVYTSIAGEPMSHPESCLLCWHQCFQQIVFASSSSAITHMYLRLIWFFSAVRILTLVFRRSPCSAPCAQVNDMLLACPWLIHDELVRVRELKSLPQGSKDMPQNEKPEEVQLLQQCSKE